MYRRESAPSVNTTPLLTCNRTSSENLDFLLAMGEGGQRVWKPSQNGALSAGEMKGRLVPNWCKLENMLTHFPKAFPEIPISNVEWGCRYYVNVLGLQFRLG